MTIRPGEDNIETTRKEDEVVGSVEGLKEERQKNSDPIEFPCWLQRLRSLSQSGTCNGKAGGSKDEIIAHGEQNTSGTNIFSPFSDSLDEEFKCEICGNLRFLERKSFENHFKFWRHQLGLRRIGLPNSKIFKTITSIEEAQVRWEKVRAQRRASKWLPEPDGEYEDEEGNRIYGQTYIDLHQQGLL